MNRNEGRRLECAFCAIVAGRAPASIVYRDRGVLAFMDINPVRRGHLLVIPAAHRAQIWELDEAESAAVSRRLPALAAAVKAAVTAAAVTIFSLNGRASGQTVFHLHFHLVPVHARARPLRRHGRRLTFRFVQRRASRAELDALARRIHAGLEAGSEHVPASSPRPLSRRRAPPRARPGPARAGGQRGPTLGEGA